MISIKALTPTQQAVYDFIASALSSGHPCPTHREIAAHFGFASSYAAVCHVRALLQKGNLLGDPGKARSLRLPSSNRASRSHLLPLFGSIPAGFGRDQEAKTEAEDWISVDAKALGIRPSDPCFALRVVGDSMVGRHILDGDIAIVEAGSEPRSGQVVAALIDRQSTLKTLILRRGKPYLQAANPKYPELIPSEELSIQGVLRAVIRRVNPEP